LPWAERQDAAEVEASGEARLPLCRQTPAPLLPQRPAQRPQQPVVDAAAEDVVAEAAVDEAELRSCPRERTLCASLSMARP
jgi:hypothetical protein